MLLICFRSEQMSFAQLRRHMAEDPDFATFIRRELGLSPADLK